MAFWGLEDLTPVTGRQIKSSKHRCVFALLHREELRTAASVEAALFGDGPDVKELIQELMVDGLAVLSFFIHQSDAIQAIHFAVVAHSEGASNLFCQPTARVGPDGNYGAGRNWNRK